VCVDIAWAPSSGWALSCSSDEAQKASASCTVCAHFSGAVLVMKIANFSDAAFACTGEKWAVLRRCLGADLCVHQNLSTAFIEE
jgi:hypothetical protein